MGSNNPLKLVTHTSIGDSETDTWKNWLADDAIFNHPEILAAMESTGCATVETGWKPQHLSLYENDELKAFLPVYHKTHSYGEYMFDWQWVNGFHRAGIGYYPKAVSAIPFTPVTGQRLIQESTNNSSIQKAIIEHMESLEISNFQCLYLTEAEAKQWQDAGALIRHGYQFSWYNDNYEHFDQFLDKLRSSARKKIRRERRQIAESKLSFKRYRGKEITDEIWDFFILCYKRTYLKRSGHEGYLNKSFYDAIRLTHEDQLMLVVAYIENELLAASLNFVAGNTLYGRYWGTLQDVDGLHFEVCYYQGIEYCIEEKLACYHPGTQGDYKRRRGFIPEYTYGIYHFASGSIRPAIEEYLELEYRELQQQFDHWQLSSPYKQE